jgi:hypothetical protein
MGVSTSAGQLAAKFEGLAKDIGNVRLPLEATALHTKKLMESSAASAGALGRTPAGRRKPIGVRYDFKGRGNTLGVGQVIVTYTGPAHLLNNPTRPHVIAAKRLRLGRSRTASGRRRAERLGATLAFGGSTSGFFGALGPAQTTTRSGAVRSGGKRALTIGANLRAYAFHPGTAGKGFFQKARTAAVASAPRVYAKAGLTAPLKRNF